MTVNTPNLDLATINTYIEYGEIPPICSQDIEQKRDSDINHGPNSRHIYKVWSNCFHIELKQKILN